MRPTFFRMRQEFSTQFPRLNPDKSLLFLKTGTSDIPALLPPSVNIAAPGSLTLSLPLPMVLWTLKSTEDPLNIIHSSLISSLNHLITLLSSSVTIPKPHFETYHFLAIIFILHLPGLLFHSDKYKHNDFYNKH